MFPIDQATFDYDSKMLAKFDAIVADDTIPPLGSILPSVKKAGEDAGCLNEEGAELLGLAAGIPGKAYCRA